MKSFRNPKYLERYEDVVFDLEQALDIDPANTAYQNRVGLKIVANNTGEATPFDWYKARSSVDFKVDKLANAAALAATDHNEIVNGSNSFIKNLKITANGREAYSCNYANHCVNIKNLLEYNPSSAESIGTNEFYFLTQQEVQRRLNIQHEMLNTVEMMLILLMKQELLWMVLMQLIIRGSLQERHCWVYHPK